MSSSSKPRQFGTLLVATIFLSVCWLVILPRYAQQPAMRDHLQWLEDRKIDPSAMYYTELEAMEEILARQRSKQLAAKQQRP